MQPLNEIVVRNPHLSLVKPPVSGEIVESIPGGLCPTCHFPLSEFAHGWVKRYTNAEKEYEHRLVPCPTCSVDAVRRKRGVEQEELVAKLFGESQIPFHGKSWEFSTYPPDADQKALHQVLDFVERHLSGDEESQRGLWLAGSAGRCKTGLAVCALKTVLQHGQVGLFTLTIKLMNRLRGSFSKDSADSSDDLLNAVTRVPWLVLDDIATERPTPYVLEQFYFIVEERRSQGLYTIFTSNLGPKDLDAYWRPDGVAPGKFHNGTRVIERIKEYCQPIPVSGRNQRG